jgi:transcription-repair coupling factor (superfamily II helicase)
VRRFIREAKENHDNPECGEQSFSGKQRKFFDYISENGAVYQNSEDLFSQLDKQFDRAEEAFEKLSSIKHATPDQLF